MRISKSKIALLLVPAIFGMTISCNDEFLTVTPTGQLTEEVLTSQTGLEGLLIGAYSAVNGRGNGWHGGATNWLWGSIRGGEANKGTNAGDFSSMNPIERFETEPNNSEVLAKWRGSYEGVARANILLANLAKAAPDVSEAVKKRIEAEAKFLRGHYYFELKKHFNMVPYVDETMDQTTANAVKNDTDVWPKIEADLQFAFDNLPEIQGQVGRVNKWAAGAFLAKAYLYQAKFAQAKTLFDQIIASGKTSDGQTYGLFPDFAGLFRFENENSQESVFAYQATGGAQNTNNANHEYAMNYPYNTLPGNCCGFFHPSFDIAASYRTSGGLPLVDGSYRTGANELKTDQGLASNTAFVPDAGPLDPRIDYTVGRRGIPFLDWGPHKGFDWIRDQSYAGPYSPKKYTYAKAEEGSLDGSGWTPGYMATNYMIMRYGDILLMAAEAEVEVGSLTKALEYVNMVRARAKNSTPVRLADGTPAANYQIELYPSFASQADAREKVRFERKLELALEGHRFYDLVRWGVADATLDSYLSYEAGKIPSHFAGATFTPNNDEFLPIPQREIDLQSAEVLTQNQGY